MKLPILISILIFNIIFVNAQQTITKVLADKETHAPIVGAHIYLNNNFRLGTVSNIDGRFAIYKRSPKDSLSITHLSYTPIKLAFGQINSDTLFLTERTNALSEVVVRSLTGKEMLKRVIDSLENNYAHAPVKYNAYVRVMEYEKDYSKLHVLSEYDMNLYQRNKSSFDYCINKTRVAPFSKEGKKYFKDMRIMMAIGMAGNNIYKWKEDFLTKGKLKNYDIRISSQIEQDKRTYTQLTCKPLKNENVKEIVLLIDMADYGIKKKIKYYTVQRDRYNEVAFKKVDNKWFLQSSKYHKNTDMFKKWNEKSDAVVLREVVYNIDTFKYDKKLFKPGLFVVANPIKEHMGEWSDSFWEDKIYIPLPDNIKALMKSE